MQTAPQFDATTWISANTRGGPKLSQEASAAVANFTLMWNLFEDVACNNGASINALHQYIKNVSLDEVDPAIFAQLEECLTFWKFRYRTPDGFAQRFFGLYFRKGDKQDLVESVLEDRENGREPVLLALAIITYRLRNNLFHGLKSVEMLNDQIHNLNNASRCLGLLLNLAAPHPLIRHAL